ncbi:MAG: HAD family hydrolase [Nanoarchaeota archaeon]
MIKAVGFDLDKTLYVPFPGIDEKIQEYASLRTSIFLGLDYETTKARFGEVYNQLKSGRRTLIELGLDNNQSENLMQDALENADIVPLLKKDERLNQMLSRISDKYKTFLITGSREPIAQRKLEALGLSSVPFNSRLYAGSEYQRDTGEAFNYVASVLGVTYEEMMFVGDRENVDIIPAKNLGMKTAIVNTQSKEATYQLKTIYDLESILL